MVFTLAGCVITANCKLQLLKQIKSLNQQIRSDDTTEQREAMKNLEQYMKKCGV